MSVIVVIITINIIQLFLMSYKRTQLSDISRVDTLHRCIVTDQVSDITQIMPCTGKCSEQTALEREVWLCTYPAYHEPESVMIGLSYCR